MSRDGIIAIGSSICAVIITSILFSLIGCICRRRQGQKSLANKQAPIYESVQIENNTGVLDLETNMAYVSVQESQQ